MARKPQGSDPKPAAIVSAVSLAVAAGLAWIGGMFSTAPEAPRRETEDRQAQTAPFDPSAEGDRHEGTTHDKGAPRILAEPVIEAGEFREPAFVAPPPIEEIESMREAREKAEADTPEKPLSPTITVGPRTPGSTTIHGEGADDFFKEAREKRAAEAKETPKELSAEEKAALEAEVERLTPEKRKTLEAEAAEAAAADLKKVKDAEKKFDSSVDGLLERVERVEGSFGDIGKVTPEESQRRSPAPEDAVAELRMKVSGALKELREIEKEEKFNHTTDLLKNAIRETKNVMYAAGTFPDNRQQAYGFYRNQVRLAVLEDNLQEHLGRKALRDTHEDRAEIKEDHSETRRDINALKKDLYEIMNDLRDLKKALEEAKEGKDTDGKTSSLDESSHAEKVALGRAIDSIGKTLEHGDELVALLDGKDGPAAESKTELLAQEQGQSQTDKLEAQRESDSRGPRTVV